MNPLLVLLASQIAASAANLTALQPSHGARTTAMATAEILPYATTRDDDDRRTLHRHRRRSDAGRVTIEFE